MAFEQSNAYVIAPSDADEAAGILRGALAAAREGVKVRVGIVESPYLGFGEGDRRRMRETAGGDTAPGSERPAAAAGIPSEFASKGGTILLSHDRMRSILEVSKPDLLAVVQGGVRHGELAAAAASEGLHFPHTPEIDMTIAEMVMDGTIFPTEGGFGALREYMLSLELVTPAGETVRFGSRAIKDVGGYELISFLLGQGGRCGFVSSVTLRLLPEPCCRAFVAGVGEVRTLKAMAHNARRDFRLSSTLIYEGRAAALIAGIWSDTLEKRGKTLPPVLEPGGKALLIGEMQGLEHVVEDQLHALAGTDSWGGASLALLDEELFDISKSFLPLAFNELEGRGPVVYVSHDGGAAESLPSGSFGYRSLYPERINAVVPVRKAGAATSPIETIKADPALGDFLSGLIGTLRRERVYLIGRKGKDLRRIRVSNKDLLGLVSGEGVEERLERAQSLNALNEKIFRAFDPESIMII
jgi:hypothetical protein